MACHNCKADTYREDKFCRNCGINLSRVVEVFYFCSRCRKNMSWGNFCTECGGKLDRIED